MKIKSCILGIVVLLVLIIMIRINPISNLYEKINGNLKIEIDSSLWHTISIYPEFAINKRNIPHVSLYGTEAEEISEKENHTKKGIYITTEQGLTFHPYNDSITKPNTLELRKMHSLNSLLNMAGHIKVKEIDSLFNEKLIEKEIYVNSLTVYHNLDSGRIEYSTTDTLSYFEAPFHTEMIKVGMKKEVRYQSFVKYPYGYVIKTIAKANLPYLIIISVLLITLISLCILKRVRRLRAIRDAKREKEIEALVEIAKKEVKERIEEEFRAIKTQDGVPVVEVDNINKVCRTLNYYYDRKIQGGMSCQNKELMTLFLHKPYHTLLQSEVIIGLWGGMVIGHKERLKKCIQRFRECLEKYMPELSLVTIKGKGYTLIIPNPDIIDEVVVIEPLDFQGTEAELNKVRRIEIQKIKAVEDTKKRLEEERLQSQNEAAASTHKKTPEEKQPKQDEQDEQNKQNEEDRIE